MSNTQIPDQEDILMPEEPAQMAEEPEAVETEDFAAEENAADIEDGEESVEEEPAAEETAEPAAPKNAEGNTNSDNSGKDSKPKRTRSPKTSNPAQSKSAPQMTDSQFEIFLQRIQEGNRQAAAAKEGYEKKTSLAVINSAIRSKSVLRDKVISVGKSEQFGFLRLYHGDIEVRVRFEESSDMLPEDLLKDATHSTVSRQFNMLRKQLGAELPYIPYGIGRDADGSEYVNASVTKALSAMRYDNFIRSHSIYPGSTANMTITAVSKQGIFGFVGGVECRLKVFKAVFRYTEDLRNVYNVGDIIPVKVQSVKVTKNNGKFDNAVSLEVSARDYQMENAVRKHRNKIHIGAPYPATIINVSRDPVNPNGSPRYTLCIDTFDYPILSHVVQTTINLPEEKAGLVPGDRVLVVCTAFGSNGFAYGRIQQYIRC